MKIKLPFPCLGLAVSVFSSCAGAQTWSGVQPEVSVLQISDAEGQAQIAVKNGDPVPLLLHTRVYDVQQDPSVQVFPLSPVIRIEAHSRQIVRFVLQKTAEPLTVQHYKRVSFEGIPSTPPGNTSSNLRVNLRYDLPVIISPKDLPPNDTPWLSMEWSIEGRDLLAHNQGPYVVRMAKEVELLPGKTPITMMQRAAILPGETLRVRLPDDVAIDTLTGVRLSPTSLYGFAAADYDARLKR